MFVLHHQCIRVSLGVHIVCVKTHTLSIKHLLALYVLDKRVTCLASTRPLTAMRRSVCCVVYVSDRAQLINIRTRKRQ